MGVKVPTSRACSLTLAGLTLALLAGRSFGLRPRGGGTAEQKATRDAVPNSARGEAPMLHPARTSARQSRRRVSAAVNPAYFEYNSTTSCSCAAIGMFGRL